MWLVRLALRRPYTVGALCVLIVIVGALSAVSMIVDVFPVIDIPVVGVVWSYNGLSPQDMERRVVLIAERAYSTTVAGIASVDSNSILGLGLMRIYFQPGTDIGSAIAQINSVSDTILRIAPPGMTPPIVISFNASNLPVVQLLVTGDLSEQRLFDYGLNFIRVKLFTIPGLSTPAPYGGKQRQINVDVDPKRLLAEGISPQDVVNAVQAQNIILPAGQARIGRTEFTVMLNGSPTAVSDFMRFPVKVVDGRPVLLGDVAVARDAYADQTNIVRVNGRRATYLNILRKANASTLTVVDAVRKAIPGLLATAPAGMQLKLAFDQSVFVRGSIVNVLREAVLAAVLVSLMVLLFLGNWRAMVIVCTSIPLAILVSVIGLKISGQSVNLMTLGGLSLAIGMLVDDATVEIENIERNRRQGYGLTAAILRGASQVALPAIMATLSICIVFLPVGLLNGPARFLFVALAEAVVYAMLASYVLSRTLVPTLARLLYRGHPARPEDEPEPKAGFGRLAFRYNIARERGLDRLRESYGRLLSAGLAHRSLVLAGFAVLLAMLPFLWVLAGEDFFPSADAGLMKLHLRTPSGMRIEDTEQVVARAEDRIRRIIPPEELDTIDSMIGLPISYNLGFVPTDNVGDIDAEILVALNQEHHRPTAEYMRRIRSDFAAAFPGCAVYFQAADIVNQVLNFGLTSPIDVQIAFPDLDKAYAYARLLRDKLRLIPGTADVVIKQVLDYPTLRVDVDRLRAAELGLTQRDAANSLLTSLTSSILVAPSYYLNPSNNVNYSVAVKTPLPEVSSVDQLLATSVTPAGGAAAADPEGPPGGPTGEPETPSAPEALPGPQAERLRNLAVLRTDVTPAQISHHNVQRVLDVTSNVEGRDLGEVADDIDKAIRSLGKLPEGMDITVQGQGAVMRRAFGRLALGLILSVALVYLLMVVLYQSWLDPLIVLFAIPGAFVGILWMLVLSKTTLNVISFLGAIMAVGIAASNSILLVSFANDDRVDRRSTPVEAALAAGKTRLRPVLMTALAMILGMLPTALGLGEGGAQNAPLGKAVIGGLLVATLVTLFVVPVVYSLLRTAEPSRHRLDEQVAKEEAEGQRREEGHED